MRYEIDTDSAQPVELAIIAVAARTNLRRLRDFIGLEGDVAAAFDAVDGWLRSEIEHGFAEGIVAS